MSKSKTVANSVPQFWRDSRLPCIEARYLADGRQASYGKHAHQTFSIGAVMAGESSFVIDDACHHVAAGSVVIIHPGEVHACNPIAGQSWSYCMLYVDADWLAALQRELTHDASAELLKYAVQVSRDPGLYQGLLALHACLVDAGNDLLQKQEAALQYFSTLHMQLHAVNASLSVENHKLQRAAEFIHTHCTQDLRLEAIAACAGLSASYLFRAFKNVYGLSPHAYLINRRIQYAQTLLKRGAAIADAAQEAGFADQAHFQRVFKRMLSATPGQYQG
ncbi:MAG: AraC family transcriptional regulator [Burkholderiales bacterium]|nr:AraC family transcriptional regulator [Burkholderiales bacterium]